MNLEEAKQMIALHYAGDCEDCFEGSCTDFTKGFIEGFHSRDKDVEFLIESLKNIKDRKHAKGCQCSRYEYDCFDELAEEILKTWEKLGNA